MYADSGSNAAASAMSSLLMVALLAVLALLIASMWRIYTKAGQPGWSAIVPFYNIYVLMKIIGRPGWWLLLFFLPVVSLIVSVVTALDLAKVFGKDSVFGVVGLWLFSFVGYPMLAFGNATYVGPGGGAATVAPAMPVAPAASTPPATDTPSEPQA
jgi:hypothetical protein